MYPYDYISGERQKNEKEGTTVSTSRAMPDDNGGAHFEIRADCAGAQVSARPSPTLDHDLAGRLNQFSCYRCDDFAEIGDSNLLLPARGVKQSKIYIRIAAVADRSTHFSIFHTSEPIPEYGELNAV